MPHREPVADVAGHRSHLLATRYRVFVLPNANDDDNDQYNQEDNQNETCNTVL